MSLDQVYMAVCQAMTGSGGWPLNVLLTPERVPFFAGTYYPKEPRGHMPSFLQLLASVANAWGTKRRQLTDQAQRLTAAVRSGIPAEPAPQASHAARAAVEMLSDTFDTDWGGFGSAPKFPQAPVLELLLRIHTLDAEMRDSRFCVSVGQKSTCVNSSVYRSGKVRKASRRGSHRDGGGMR